MKIKNIIRASILLGLLASFGYYLTYSKKGIATYLELKKELLKEQTDVKMLTKEVADLNQSLQEWHGNLVAKELTVRNEFHMTYTNEMLYVIKQETLPLQDHSTQS